MIKIYHDRNMIDGVSKATYFVILCAKKMSPILPEFIKGLTLKTKDFAVKSSSSKLWMPQDLFFLTKIHPISEKISE